MLFKVFRNEERPDGFIWAQYFDTNSENEMRFLGYMESEDSFYLPNKQPFENYFLIVQAREYNGVLHLLNKDGEWKELPGYYYGVVGKIIYTKAAGDGDQLVTSYNLETNELFTKVYNNINGTDPWGISDNYNYVNINWIKIP